MLHFWLQDGAYSYFYIAIVYGLPDSDLVYYDLSKINEQTPEVFSRLWKLLNSRGHYRELVEEDLSSISPGNVVI